MTYHKRLFAWLVGYSLLMVACFVGFQYHREKQFKAEELNTALQGINAHILAELEAGVPPSDVRLKGLSDLSDLRLSVISPEGHVVYDNSLDTLPTSNHLSRTEISEAKSNGSGYSLRRHSESTGQTYFYSARKDNEGRIVRTAVPYSVTLDDLLSADYGFLRIVAIITAVMCLLGYFATRRVGVHVSRLRDFAAKAERSENIADMRPFPNDELGEISNHIVRLYGQLRQALIDRDLEHSEALNQQQEKERIKKQLTNNINHELKTPVASIQACIETLLLRPDLPPEKKTEFLNRCLDNTHRLNRLLADVALITRMDDAPQLIVKEQVDLAAIVSETVADSESRAAGRGIRICNNITGPLEISGNRSLLASIFRNLIDNAIAYSGCDLIEISLVSDSFNSLIITFADNGCGIAPEHLPHLFERFYRIDKGRSRASGGTGLGLSIVRHAVANHGGIISVENRRGGGLLFTILIKP